jgi:hypothetical protein
MYQLLAKRALACHFFATECQSKEMRRFLAWSAAFPARAAGYREPNGNLWFDFRRPESYHQIGRCNFLCCPADESRRQGQDTAAGVTDEVRIAGLCVLLKDLSARLFVSPIVQTAPAPPCFRIEFLFQF